MSRSAEALKKSFQKVKDRIALACEKSGRNPDEVHLLAVSKGRSAEEIVKLYQLGQRHFGENYADEFVQKQAELKSSCPDICWHFIGQIQSNKIKKIVHADIIHSVNSEKCALAIAKNSGAKNPFPVFLQVNLSDEAHRGGISKTTLQSLLNRVLQLENLQVKGLMAVLPLASSTSEAQNFKLIAKLRNSLEEECSAALPDLSMGMSGDFEEAILFGATWVRIGTLIFGERRVRV